MNRAGLAVACTVVELICVFAAGQSRTMLSQAVKGLVSRAPAAQAQSQQTEPTPSLVPSHPAPGASATGRRDPFLSPLTNRSMVAGTCSGGRRCLAVDQISLKGIVSARTGMIAVVVTSAGKAYFLREKDVLVRGYVKRITEDSVVFSETVLDKLGKATTHDVVRKLGVSPSV